MSSILDDVKHMLGLLPSGIAFDSDIMIHINSVFTTLNQLGVGPVEGYFIEDRTDDWEDFLPSHKLNAVKSYMFLRVKLFLDPPQIGFVISSMDRQIQELEWRLMVEADTLNTSDDVVIDGGSP